MKFHRSMNDASLCLCAVLAFTLQVAAPGQCQMPIHATQLSLSNQQLDPDENYQVIRAFVATGTTDANCLVSLGDTNFVQLGTLIFCAPRAPLFGSEIKGVLVSVFYPYAPPPGLVLTVTLYQEDAVQYGMPILCTKEDGC